MELGVTQQCAGLNRRRPRGLRVGIVQGAGSPGLRDVRRNRPFDLVQQYCSGAQIAHDTGDPGRIGVPDHTAGVVTIMLPSGTGPTLPPGLVDS
jgi:hypothetical protein